MAGPFYRDPIRPQAAVAAYKTRGGKLDASRPECRNQTAADRQRGAIVGAQTVREQGQTAIAYLHETVTKLRLAGFSLQNIADSLNAKGHTTQRGNAWTYVAILRICV